MQWHHVCGSIPDIEGITSIFVHQDNIWQTLPVSLWMSHLLVRHWIRPRGDPAQNHDWRCWKVKHPEHQEASSVQSSRSTHLQTISAVHDSYLRLKWETMSWPRCRFYPIMHDLLGDFTSPWTKWNPRVIQTKRDIMCIFHRHNFLLLHHKCYCSPPPFHGIHN